MLDNIKLSTKDQRIINRLAKMPGFTPYRHRNNNFAGFRRYGNLMRLDFRKSFENGNFAGYHHVEISISPHYHYNNYLHNGNDFTPQQCIKTLEEILQYIAINPDEYDALEVVNIEFGLNIIPEIDIQYLINNILYYKKTPFIIPEPKNEFSKRTDNTKYKYLKAYAKGLQFADSPQFRINLNTFRFEVKSKKSLNIKKYGIDDVTDLLKIEIYQRLGQELLNEWDNVLLTNLTPDFSTLKPEEMQYIKRANKTDFWKGLTDAPRNKFSNEKRKYYKILKGKNNLHTQIKGQFVDKILFLSESANLPQRTPIKTTIPVFIETPLKEINGQSAPPQQLNRFCLTTGLDISMQKKGSKYLCFAGLKYYRENKIEIYKDLEKKYLSEKMKVRTIEKQMYYIAHNIRNSKTNSFHNQKRFEKRNYNPNQLQFQF